MTVTNYYVKSGGVVVARFEDGHEEVVTPAQALKRKSAEVISLSWAVRQKFQRWAA